MSVARTAILVAAIVPFGGLPMAGQAVPPVNPSLVLDGRTGEWSALPAVARSPSGRFLVLGVETARPILIQADGGVTVTWTPPPPRAEVRWDYAGRSGWSGDRAIGWADIGLRVHPTARADVFELGFEVAALGEALGVDEGDVVGYRVETDGREVLAGEFSWPAAPSPTRVELPSPSPGALRVVSWNLESSALFEPERQGAIGRVLRAVDADLLLLQEVYDSTAAATARTLNELLPTARGPWRVRKAGDIVVAAPDSLGRGVDIGFSDFGRAMAVPWHVEGRDAILAVGVHLPCCNGGAPSADDRRAFLLEQMAALAGAVPGEHPPEANILRIIGGDLNLVGRADVLAPLTHPNTTDGTDRAFRVVPAVHLDGEETFTWMRSRPGYAPGVLDFVLVNTRSRAEVERAFVLDDDDLERDRGIRPGDVLLASDHLPVVLDVRPAPSARSNGNLRP